MKKTLFSFYEELQTLFFDKKKVQGLVKRAKNAGYDIYYAYHEDSEDTWKHGWSSDDYKNEDNDVKIYEATTLICKKKATRSFTKAQTYTAECAIFIFCPIQTLLEDEILRERKITAIKNGVEKNAISDWNRSVEMKAAFDKWNQLPQENKTEINKLVAEISANMGQPGNRKIREEKEKRIANLGGVRNPLHNWNEKALSFESIEYYIAYRQDIAVVKLLKETEITT